MLIQTDDSTKKEKRKKIIEELWHAFESEYPKKEDRIEAVYKFMFPDESFTCVHCGSSNICKKYGARTLECEDCKMDTWITAGSFFDRVRKITPWLAFIWIMEKGVVLNSSELSKLTGIAASSAQHILKKVAYVVTRKMEKQDMNVATSILFSEIICKRSKETPAREHPIAEVFELGKLNTGFEKKEPQCGDQSDTKRVILNHLSDQPLQLEDLREKVGCPISELISNLTVMQMDGSVTQLAGEKYIKGMFRYLDSAKSLEGRLKSFFGKAKLKTTKSFIKNIFQGISRKYLQFYLAVIWVCVENRDWSDGTVLKECLDYGEIEYKTIHSYVSPKFVRVVPVV